MGYFALNIGSNSAEEDVDTAITNLNLFLGSLKDGGKPCDYLLDFAISYLNQAKEKVEEGRLLKERGPETPSNDLENQ